MSKREELENANDKFKNALESQLGELKNNFDKVGKSALIVGGGLLGAYLLSTVITGGGNKKLKKGKKEKPKKVEMPAKGENLLASTLKEQAIVFLLGIAAERLASFLKEVDVAEDEK
ncbi:hypothetical protein BFP97_17145 [Roseivirga sp. 4D4]|uniref:hypothetical protein n=1 Tax=Roseivirga sp. 4D4 TaxID=1889784 RepID=UPI00085324AA|nr:hypothetical protein [Roseivirga sp. 4D4]OEK03140.1 hypothetical protein BFP97_17145 [Roseivirga sp. 4D4]